MAAYSGTPLQKKLGLTDVTSACALRPPVGFCEQFEGLHWVGLPDQPTLIVAFTVWQNEVTWPVWAEATGPHGVIWVAWPKKASKVPTDLNGNIWRELVLPTGWVDVKVCAIDDTWSGLKFVLRKELRPPR